jgi:hypothetical protein
MKTLKVIRDVPVARECDVLVAGGGPAGIAAAIAAARNGASTVLVEQYGFLGGTSTAGLVGPFMTSSSLDGTIQLVRGIFDELVNRMEAMGGAIHPSKVPAGSPYSAYIEYGAHHTTPFHPETMKLVSAEMCLEAGVDLYLHSFLADAIIENDTVTGALVANKSGLQAIQARVAVDCTGDGDLAFWAGAEMVKGREQDGKMQPLSMFFRIGNVDRARVEAHRQAHPDDIRPFAGIIREARERGEYPIPRLGVNMHMEPDGWAWRINTSRLLGLDATQVDDLITGEIEGRRQVAFLMGFFRQHLPGFKNCILLETGTQVGVRETRRIMGEYILTQEDLGAGRLFDDSIAFAGFPIDIHQVDGAGGIYHERLTANIYSIPYRSLLPKRVEQLLVAGRCLSATHEAAGAVRVMPHCFATGQAAGTAAALAVRHGVAPRSVSVLELQQQLLAGGAYLEPLSHRVEPIPPASSR